MPDKPRTPVIPAGSHTSTPTTSPEDRKRQMEQFEAERKARKDVRVVKDAGFPVNPRKR